VADGRGGAAVAPPSGRARAVLATLALAAVALLPADVGLVEALRHQAEESVAAAGRAQTLQVAALLRAGVPARTLVASSHGELLQLVDPSGVVAAASVQLLGAQPLAIGTPSRRHPGVAIIDLRRLPSGAEGPYLVVSTRTQAGAAVGLWVVHVVAPVRVAGLPLRTVAVSLGAGLPAVLLLLVGTAAWIVAGRIARPAEAVRATAAERQRRFVADASHELRSPLTTIVAQLEVAIAHPERADWVATAEEVVREARRMQRIVDDLLLLARTDEGAAPLRVEPVDLDELLLAEARRLRDRGAVEVDVSHVSGARVSGDHGQLAQVVHNLLGNAERHAAAVVRLELAVRGDVAELAVVDDGPGIPLADRERVFERFTRLDEARSRGHGGAGLGLAIARQIVQAHGGTITVGESDVGARLVVRLPAGHDLTG
jgi:signal transduction histidine kinase